MKALLRLLALIAALHAGAAAAQTWPEIVARARGQTVYFNAWAGDESTNAFIAWVGEQMHARHGLTVRQVRLRDTSEAVQRVIAERAAGRDSGGSVDLVWINGPNFLAMQERHLLHGPFVEQLPNFRLVDTVNQPSNLVDFTVPVNGLASPWRLARVVFIHDAARLPSPPRTMRAMLDWARAHPGRLTHPHVRNFLGATFLKQALYELAANRAALMHAPDDADYEAQTAPLWAWYEALRPHLWRGGRQFPENGPAQRQLLNDGEIDLYIAFNPAEAHLAIARGELPASARPYVLEGGTIGNTSFVAIPLNAANREGAMLVANFLLSPEAQARAADPAILGAPTVLDVARLPAEARAIFDALPRAPTLLTPQQLGPTLPEPHPAWMTRLTADWERRVQR